MNKLASIEINREALVDDLVNMVGIPSVNPFGAADQSHSAEAGMADYLEARLRALGFEVGSKEVLPDRRNVWGVLKGQGDGPCILLAGHLDTVGVDGYVGPFTAKVEDGKVFGRGSCDMKAGLAAYLEVARLLIQTGTLLSGDLIIAGVIDEEHAMIGSKDFGLTGPAADFAIVAEPTQLAICPAHKGQILTTLKTHGVAAHSSMPDKGVNAIYHMSSVLQGLQSYAHDLSQCTPDPKCGAPSFSVGVIRGGDNACSVPDFCEIDIDRRTIPGEQHDKVIGEISATVMKIQSQLLDFSFELKQPFLNLPPLATEDGSQIVQAIKTACEDVKGRGDIQAFPGSTDAPNFNCPTVICGPGNLEQCHSLNEYVAIDEIEDAVRIYVKTILAMQAP
ncbi:MAG: acetylornithine deacetylase/succinyl-diaminopimelate desuccinylase family protein [Paracoccaceae bacterium]|jgi:acetylornithine deacetylase/succinyl-diaminopimelate desuccinylase family protein